MSALRLSYATISILVSLALLLTSCVTDSSVIVVAGRGGEELRGARNPRVHAACAEVAREYSLEEHLVHYGTWQDTAFGRRTGTSYGDPSIYIHPANAPDDIAQVSVDNDFGPGTRHKIATQLQLALVRKFGEGRVRAFECRGIDF